MADIKCNECGAIIPNGVNECPNCGCPIENVGNANYHGNDDFDYSQYYEGILRAWHISCSKSSEKESYDVLNDFFLMCNLIFRIILRSVLIPCGVYLVGAILGTTLLSQAPVLSIIINSLFVIAFYVLLVIYVGKAIGLYWVPLHRIFRRMNKRYWIAMHKAVKENTINNI